MTTEKMLTCKFCGENNNTFHFLSYGNTSWYKCGLCKGSWKYPYNCETENADRDVNKTYSAYESVRDEMEIVASEKAEWIVSKLSGIKAIIELGAGLGAVAKQINLRKLGIDFTMIEPNPVFSKPLIEAGLNVLTGDPSRELAGILSTCRTDGGKALIFMDNVLEHISNPFDTLKMINELAPAGSKVLIEVPNENGIEWRYRINNILRGYAKPPTFPGHINLFGKRSMKALLQRAGLKNIVVRYRGVRTRNQIVYLTQNRNISGLTLAALAVLNCTGIDYMLGVPYWIRAEAIVPGGN